MQTIFEVKFLIRALIPGIKCRKFLQNMNSPVSSLPTIIQRPDIDFEEIPPDETAPRSVLDPANDDLSHFTQVNGTFNFARYINSSDTLKNLFNLGVNLHKIEKTPKYMRNLLLMDFERDMKKHITFLNDYMDPSDIGATITKNPMIFKEDLDDLQIRINYLESKKFEFDMLKRIITRNPFWLMFSTERIDRRLGFFQKEFSLHGDEVRYLATKQPKLITYTFHQINLNRFSLKEEMGFSDEEVKSIVLNKPRLLMINQTGLIKTFNFVHLNMKIPHSDILKMPQVLTCKTAKLKERHTFLEKIGRAQYDCKKPHYVSLVNLIEGTDAEFCFDVAKCSLKEYNLYLKTL